MAIPRKPTRPRNSNTQKRKPEQPVAPKDPKYREALEKLMKIGNGTLKDATIVTVKGTKFVAINGKIWKMPK